ncbi:MAG: serine/threonine-protein phosphatase [Treponema sp.]|nr:serine/threonine-protein phosphatase [Treponema sp.]
MSFFYVAFNIINVILAIFFIAETIWIDRIESKNEDSTNPVTTNVLILAITTSLYAIFCFFRFSLTPNLFTLCMRVCFLLEGCMLVNVVFCFAYYGWKYSSGFTYFLKFLLYFLCGYFIFFRFKRISVSAQTGLLISSDYLFKGDAWKFFPYTWADLYNAIFRFILPMIGCLAMIVRNEMTGNKLDRHKSFVYSSGLIAMWLLILGVSFISKVFPGYSALHYYMYVPIMLILPATSYIPSAPSAKGVISFWLKNIFFIALPAVLLGIAFMFLLRVYDNHGIAIAIGGGFLVVVVSLLLLLLYRPIRKLKFSRSADYAAAFEKDLASIDYSGEMSAIADTMFDIFKKNVEASAMYVYINGGNATFENAYTSSGKKVKIDSFEMMFESLLNTGINVVVQSQLEASHVLMPFRDELTDLFKKTESDALFILNEGRDVHGIIMLGVKDGGEHYKEYDYNVFTKLYSYFFVFGYYMRNISNKEIIGTVNRELKMSAQIITSIQENYDPVNSSKMDAGAVMIPAHNIGGEFIDMIRLTDTRHLFVMGDLSGKGIAASMNMVILKSIIRAYLRETHDFKQLVVKANHFIRYNLPKGTIFSGMFAIMNFENDTLYYINCGIPAMFLYTEAYNNVIEIQGSGHVLGFVSDISPYISVKQMKLHSNDIVLACTDGLIESHSLRGEPYGKDRVQRTMVANAMYPAQRMAYFAHDDLTHFMSHEMEDDVSVLVMKYLNVNDAKNDEENSTDDAIDASEDNGAEVQSA